MMQHLFVLGGSYNQSLDWVRNRPAHPKVKYIIVEKKEHIIGRNNLHGYLIGTWYKREDAGELLIQMMFGSPGNKELMDAWKLYMLLEPV